MQAAVSGGTAGLGVLYAPTTVVSVPIAAAVGGALGSIARQKVDNPGSAVNLGDAGTAAAVNTLVSLVPIPGLSTIPGVTSGRNSLAAIGKSIITKFRNDTIQTVSAPTAIKGAVGLSTYELPGTIFGEIAKSLFK